MRELRNSCLSVHARFWALALFVLTTWCQSNAQPSSMTHATSSGAATSAKQARYDIPTGQFSIELTSGWLSAIKPQPGSSPDSCHYIADYMSGGRNSRAVLSTHKNPSRIDFNATNQKLVLDATITGILIGYRQTHPGAILTNGKSLSGPGWVGRRFTITSSGSLGAGLVAWDNQRNEIYGAVMGYAPTDADLYSRLLDTFQVHR